METAFMIFISMSSLLRLNPTHLPTHPPISKAFGELQIFHASGLYYLTQDEQNPRELVLSVLAPRPFYTLGRRACPAQSPHRLLDGLPPPPD